MPGLGNYKTDDDGSGCDGKGKGKDGDSGCDGRVIFRDLEVEGHIVEERPND